VGITYPDGRKLQIERDDLDRRLNTQNLANGNNYPGDPASSDNWSIARMTYAGQQRDQCIFTSGAGTTYSHDGAGRVIEIAHRGPNTPLLAIQYLYDAANNVRVRNDLLPNVSRTERFAYDSHYRLAHEFTPDTTETFDLSTFRPAPNQLPTPITDRQSAITTLIGSLELPQIPTTYDYDLVGNRDLERKADGNNIDYEPNKLDQYISRDDTNYSHDTNGNLKLELTEGQKRFSTYDSLNRLVQVSTDEAGTDEIAGFWHDALGRRILEQVGGNVTQLICDGDDVVAEYRDGGLFAQYVFDDGIDRPLHIAAESQDHWYHADLVGSVRLLTSSEGDAVADYHYSPFGEMTVLVGTDIFNPWRYTARRFDVALETYDYRARQYEPQTGRFLQRDPGGMVDGTNLYSYVGNNSLNYTDPSGLGRHERENIAPKLSSDYALLTETLDSEGTARSIQKAINESLLNHQKGLTRETMNLIQYERALPGETYSQGEGPMNRLKSSIHRHLGAMKWPGLIQGTTAALGLFLEGRRRYSKGESRVQIAVGTTATVYTAVKSSSEAFKRSRVGGWSQFAIAALDWLARAAGAPQKVTDITGFCATNTTVGIATQGVSDFVDTSALLLSRDDVEIRQIGEMINRQATSATPAAGYSQFGMVLFGGGFSLQGDLSRLENSGFFARVADETSDRAVRVSKRVGGGTFGDVMAFGAGVPGVGIGVDQGTWVGAKAVKGARTLMLPLYRRW
jgi:RHS repeat-associated protein